MLVKQRGADVVNVLYIAGYVRSGSTLLERVLARDEDLLSLGEVHHLWERGYLMNALCACGEPFHECPFWQRLDSEAFGGLSRDAAQDLFSIRRYLLRPPAAHRVFLSELNAEGTVAHKLRRYGAEIKAVYEAASSVTGASAVIDSSKSPLHGRVLGRTPGVALHVIHLIRDPRAVAFSLRRPKIRPEVYWKEQRESVRGPARSALMWSYANVLSSRLKSVAQSYDVVRYEDFIENPNEVLDAVRRQLGLGGTGRRVSSDRRVVLAQTHAVSGNANRFEGPEVRLQLDKEWRKMPSADRHIVTTLSSPLMLKYGYNVRLPAPTTDG